MKYAVCVLVSFLIGVCGCFFVTQGYYSREIAGISARLNEGTELNKKLREANSRLTDNYNWIGRINTELAGNNSKLADYNSRLKAEVGRSRNQVAKLKEGIASVATGLGEGADIIQGVIDGLSKLAELIKNL